MAVTEGLIILAFIIQGAIELMPLLSWLAPLAVSSGVGAAAGYGSFRFSSGALLQRVVTVERDVAEIKAAHAEFVTRNEFDLLRDDLREIKTDLREVRRSLSK